MGTLLLYVQYRCQLPEDTARRRRVDLVQVGVAVAGPDRLTGHGVRQTDSPKAATGS